jgi:hypothetical protein
LTASFVLIVIYTVLQGLEQAFTFPDVPQETQQQQQRSTGGERPGKRRSAQTGATAMAIDITEEDNQYLMKMDMPGTIKTTITNKKIYRTLLLFELVHIGNHC